MNLTKMNLTKLELAIRDRAIELDRHQGRARTPEAEQRIILRRELLRDIADILLKYEVRCREEGPK